MSKIYKISIISALAGFLFGFDTVVISGADQQLQNLWNTSNIFHGSIVMSMALWGTVLGALIASYPCDKWGRKKTLVIIGILYLISALGSAFAYDPFIFSLFRFIGGVGVGLSTIAAPTYISEIAPTSKRGRLVILYQFNLVFGILIAYTSNYIFQNFGQGSWRWMMGVEAFPALIYLIGLKTVPESPRWLVVSKNNISLAKKIFKEINGKTIADIELNNLSNIQINKELLFSYKYLKPLILAFFIAFFNQLSGINFVLYYAPEILQSAGLAANDSLMSSVSIGFVNLIFTMFGLRLIDKYGRRYLMKIGSIGYIISLISIGFCFIYSLNSYVLLTFILIFIASHAIGQGTVIWVFISEIFPNSVRAKGQSLGTATHWVFAALITAITPYVINMLGNNPGMIFYFFGCMMVLQLVFVLKMMPETKGISLEEMKFNS